MEGGCTSRIRVPVLRAGRDQDGNTAGGVVVALTGAGGLGVGDESRAADSEVVEERAPGSRIEGGESGGGPFPVAGEVQAGVTPDEGSRFIEGEVRDIRFRKPVAQDLGGAPGTNQQGPPRAVGQPDRSIKDRQTGEDPASPLSLDPTVL